jgi:hypothetical protein
VSGVPPVDAAQPVHYQDDEEAQAPQPPTDGASIPDDQAPPQEKTTAAAKGGHMRYEEVVYKDEFGNIIPEDQLSSLLAEQGENIEFRTVYETQTKVLRPGEQPPPGAKRIPRPDNYEAGEVPKYPEGQNPETKEEGEKKAYRTA